jgi:hypothetical protein
LKHIPAPPPRPSDLQCYTNIYLHIFHCNIQN